MRSVIVYLKEASEDELIDYLQNNYPSESAPPWHLRTGDNVILTISAYGDFQPDSSVMSELGYAPSVAVLAEVSKRHPGDDEVYSFVVSLLEEFEGNAGDEYSDHAWTLAEVRSGLQFDGHRFFDYE